MAASIEGYASVSSAAAGDVVDFHVRATPANAHFTMQIYRRGVNDELVASAEADAFVPGPQDDAALAVSGCEWPAARACRTVVPAQWRSGYYVAKFAAPSETAFVPFFVRSGFPGSASSILLKMSDATAQAYTSWGGRSFYSTPHAPKISFDRPYDDLDLFERYQLPFLRWAELHGIVLDYCSSLDLHVNPQLLEPYRLLVSLGHDEYWSLEMRDQVEAFVAGGGNVCFLSANTCYWQVRLDVTEDRRIMTCYKETENKPSDPDRGDPQRVTVRWYEAPVSRPENRMTGVSYRNGAGWWIDPVVPERRLRGYTVANAAHWIFANTALSTGDVFGNGATVETTVLGYETDAAILVQGSDPPRAAGTDGTPSTFQVLATADLTDWAPNGQGGGATMGLYARNGRVFTAGTVNWAGGLADGGDASPVARMTQNVLRELSRERTGTMSVTNGGFEDWSDGAPAGWALDGAGAVSDVPTEDAVRTNEMRFSDPGRLSMNVDASPGETWISCSGFSLDGAKTYGAGCWIKSPGRGATIRLQTTDTWADFAVGEHSGSGEWEYIFAVGSLQRNESGIPVRVKLQVAAGGQAVFDGVGIVESEAPFA